MRILFKIIAAPFVPLLYLLWAVMTLVFSFAEAVLVYVSGFGLLCSVVMFIAGQTTGGIAFLIAAFLLSPFGLPAIARWLIGIVDALNGSLKNFITT